jgi:signal transduction histidine kinase
LVIRINQSYKRLEDTAMKTLLKRRTGLIGPAIVKQLVEAHGGRISAVSDGVGNGSTFTFTLPVA